MTCAGFKSAKARKGDDDFKQGSLIKCFFVFSFKITTAFKVIKPSQSNSPNVLAVYTDVNRDIDKNYFLALLNQPKAPQISIYDKQS